MDDERTAMTRAGFAKLTDADPLRNWVGYTDRYERAFFQHSAMLNIRRADVVCRATDHIGQQIKMAAELERRGLTYLTADGVYFDTAKLPDYGKLARLDVEGLQGGARVDLG